MHLTARPRASVFRAGRRERGDPRIGAFGHLSHTDTPRSPRTSSERARRTANRSIYAGTYGYHRARTGQAETANRAMTTPSSAEIAAMMRLAIAAITKAPACGRRGVWSRPSAAEAADGTRDSLTHQAVGRDLALKAASCGGPAWPEPCRQLVDIARRLQLRQRRREWWPRPAASQHLAVLARPPVSRSHV